MKKLVSIFLILSVMALSVSCGFGFPKKPEKAKENLEKAGYTVQIVDNSDSIKTGLTSLGIEFSGIVTMVSATDDTSNLLMIAYCEDSESANAMKQSFDTFLTEGLKSFAETYGTNIEDIAIDINDYAVECIGNAVAFGHKDMIKAAKG